MCPEFPDLSAAARPAGCLGVQVWHVAPTWQALPWLRMRPNVPQPQEGGFLDLLPKCRPCRLVTGLRSRSLLKSGSISPHLGLCTGPTFAK